MGGARNQASSFFHGLSDDGMLFSAASILRGLWVIFARPRAQQAKPNSSCLYNQRSEGIPQ